MLKELYSLRIRVILRQNQIIFCSFFDLLNPPSVVKIIIKFKTGNDCQIKNSTSTIYFSMSNSNI